MAIVTYFQSNPIVLSAVVGILVGLGDLWIALNPNIQSNGIFHAVYLFLKGKASGNTTPPPSQT